MTSFLTKLRRSFVPRTRNSLKVKSHLIPPIRNPHAFGIGSETEETDLTEKEAEIDQFNVADAYNEGYRSPIDRGVIAAVNFSGTIAAFFIMVLVLIGWVIWGIVTDGPDQWQIIMQDGQSIQCYIWDTLLMRQQLDDDNEFLRLVGRLQSRFITHKRLLARLGQAHGEGSAETMVKDTVVSFTVDNDDEHKKIEQAAALASNNWFDRFATFLSKVMGSLPCVILFWVAVLTWVGCGALYIHTGNEPPFTGERTGSNPRLAQWSNEWQMYANTGVAVILLVTSVFLGNIRNRNNKYVREQFEELSLLDCQIEGMCRYKLDDMADNEMVEVPAARRRKIKKVISVYAEIIGTGVGIVISTAVFAVWLSIGNTMEWSDNWWLIIGTYTGMVGFVDGYALREVFQSLTIHEEGLFTDAVRDSQELLEIAGIHYQLRQPRIEITFSQKVSMFLNKMCSSQWSVVGSVLFDIALICIASGLGWSVTGQLLCNTPTMIIEAFCMLILIQAHTWADYKRRFVATQLKVSRKLLFDHAKALM